MSPVEYYPEFEPRSREKVLKGRRGEGETRGQRGGGAEEPNGARGLRVALSALFLPLCASPSLAFGVSPRLPRPPSGRLANRLTRER